MKLDVLDTLNEIKVCTHYLLNNKKVIDFPADNEMLIRMKPVYKTFPGWQSSNNRARHYSDLSIKTKKYINFLEKELSVKIKFISVGPKRNQTIIKK